MILEHASGRSVSSCLGLCKLSAVRLPAKGSKMNLQLCHILGTWEKMCSLDKHQLMAICTPDLAISNESVGRKEGNSLIPGSQLG